MSHWYLDQSTAEKRHRLAVALGELRRLASEAPNLLQRRGMSYDIGLASWHASGHDLDLRDALVDFIEEINVGGHATLDDLLDSCESAAHSEIR